MNVQFLSFYHKHHKGHIQHIIAVSKEDHKDADCFLLAILSHAEDGYIYGKDGRMLLEECILPFKSGCESLAGKPKIFIFQVNRKWWKTWDYFIIISLETYGVIVKKWSSISSIPSQFWHIMACSQGSFLINWGRVTHICVSKLTIIGSDNGISPDRRQAIIKTNAGTNLNEILIEIPTFSFKKIHLKKSSGKWRTNLVSASMC